MKKRALILVGVLISVLVACATGGSDTSEESSISDSSRPNSAIVGNEQPPSVDEPVAFTNADTTGEQPSELQQQNRLVIKDASITMQVEDAEATMESIMGLAEGGGGWVVSSSTNQYTAWNGALLTQGNITFRIPSERFNETLNQVRQLGLEVISQQISGQDVTSEYTDIQSQIRNLQVAEDQLQEIMDSTSTVTDVLTVHNRLIEVRGQIETLQGRSNYLEQASAFSTITATLVPVEPKRPDNGSKSRVDRNDSWNPSKTAEKAFDVLVTGLQISADAVIWMVICGLPFAVFGVPAWFGYRRYQRRRNIRTTVLSNPADSE